MKAAPAGDIVKRVIVDEIHRTKSSSSSRPTSSSVRPTSSSLRISRSGNHRSKHKKDFHTSDDYSTGDDATDLGFSGDSSAE